MNLGFEKEKLQEILLKYQPIIWPMAIGIASLVILGLVIIPQLLTYINTRGKISKMQDHLSLLEAKAVELSRVNDSEMRPALQTVFTILPTDQDVPYSLVILQGLINQSGLSLTGTSYSASSRAAPKGSFILNLSVGGSLVSLQEFIENLHSAPQLFQIESVNIHFNGSDQIVDADIPVSVFFEADPKSRGVIDQPVSKLTDQEIALLNKLSGQINQLKTGFVDPVTATSSVIMGKVNPFE